MPRVLIFSLVLLVSGLFAPYQPPHEHTHDADALTDATATGKAVLRATDAPAARAAIGAGTSSFSGNYSDLTNKPTLGDAAAKNTGTGAGDVAAGNHSHSGLAPSGGTTGQVLKKNSNTNYDYGWGTDETGAGGSLPPGMIAAFNVDCPADWTEYTAGRGFAVVGLVASGTLEGTVGSALTDQENRTHAHTYTEIVNHTHPVTDPGHNHTQNAHTHNFLPRSATTGSVSSIVTGTLDTSSTISGSNQPHVQSATATNQSATTGIATDNPAGGVATGTTATKATGDAMPYIQLRLCRKD